MNSVSSFTFVGGDKAILNVDHKRIRPDRISNPEYRDHTLHAWTRRADEEICVHTKRLQIHTKDKESKEHDEIGVVTRDTVAIEKSKNRRRA